MSWLVHLANLLYLAAYLVKDILWLRVVTVLAGFTLLATMLMQPSPPWLAVGWNLVFATINLVHINWLLFERRPVRLSPDEALLHRLHFSAVRPRELLRLFAVGRWETHEPATVIVRRGEPLAHLMLLADGATEVRLGDGRTVELGHGRFVGEMSYLTGQTPAADVAVTRPTRVLLWPSDALRAYLRAHPELRATMQAAIGTDLVGKLRTR